MNVLMSDTQMRIDLIKIREQQWQEADEAKHQLEELQRKDKKLREASGKKKQESSDTESNGEAKE